MPLNFDQIKDINDLLKKGCEELKYSYVPVRTDWDKEIDIFKGLADKLNKKFNDIHQPTEKESETITSLNTLLDETIDHWRKKIQRRWPSDSNTFFDEAMDKYTDYLRANCASLCNATQQLESKLIVTEDGLRNTEITQNALLQLEGQSIFQTKQLEQMGEANARLNREIGEYKSTLEMIVSCIHNQSLDPSIKLKMLSTMTEGLYKQMQTAQQQEAQPKTGPRFFTNPGAANSPNADHKSSANFSAA